MYWVAGCVGGILGILFLLSLKEDAKQASSKMLRPFYRMALYLYKHAYVWKLPMVSSRQVEADLHRLYPAESKEQLCTNYYVKKISLFLVICFVGTLIGIVVSVQAKQNHLLKEDGTISRGTYAEGAKELEIVGYLDTGEENRFRIPVETQVLSEKEAQELYQVFRQELEQLILGKNESLQSVNEELILMENYEDYPFTVEWKSSRPDIVGSTGMVTSVEAKENILLLALVTYEKMQWETKIDICVIPPKLSDEERLYQSMKEILLFSEQESRDKTEWKLPTSYKGQAVTWKQVVQDNSLLLWAGTLLVALIVFLLSDKDLHDAVENRKALMKQSYPDIVQKLTLYLGAGLTVRAAFQRIAGEYEKAKQGGKKVQPVYEEMVYTCRELQAGVSEGAAYEHFGKRIGLQEYIRLSTLLMQNIKKGNSTLLQRLKEEADRACTEQLQESRRLAEEAVTKLLLPMVMMLLVVMLIIMIPAFSSVGI